MNPCPDEEAMLHALLDGELDAANVLAIEAHLKSCAGCAAYFDTLRALRGRLADPDLSPKAPPHLRGRIEAMIAAEATPARAVRTRRGGRLTAAWGATGAMAAIAASLLVVQLQPVPMSLEDQLVAGHVRSLLANHLIDVATSDRHVVKPWFNGKINFAPPVPDLATDGFPLVGGRLDYADSQVVAAVVYKRRAHVINLFVLPAQPRATGWLPVDLFHRPTSYSVVHWTRGGLDFWAVSDVEARELEQFHRAFAARAPT